MLSTYVPTVNLSKYRLLFLKTTVKTSVYIIKYQYQQELSVTAVNFTEHISIFQH